MLQQQQYQNFEIVVVDNNSEKEDAILLKSKLSKSVFLIESNINRGYSSGNNLGFKFDSGKKIDYFLVLNNDIKINDTNLLSKLLESFNLKCDLPIYAVSPLVNTLHSQLPAYCQIQVRRLLRPHQLMLLSFSIFKKLFKNLFGYFIYVEKMPFLNKLIQCDTINGAAFMIPYNFIQAINFLDESVFLFNEEMILGKQIKNFGGTCLLNGFVEVSHYQGVSTKSSPIFFNKKMEKLKISSEAFFLKKYMNVNSFYIKLFCFLKELELNCKDIYFKVR